MYWTHVPGLVLVKGKSPTARNPPLENKYPGITYSYTNSNAVQEQTDLSRLSLLYKWANSPLCWLEFMGAPGAYSSALHWLSTTQSLDNCARGQNPCGIAGSNDWNSVYCHLLQQVTMSQSHILYSQVVLILSVLVELCTWYHSVYHSCL